MTAYFTLHPVWSYTLQTIIHTSIANSIIQGVTTDDMEKAFHAIRQNGYGIDDKVYYIQFDLDFKDEDRIKFLNAVEDNPHIPKRTGALAEMSRKAEIFMHSAMHSL
jgi:uncharacterized protein YpiB (UPF0302 family)